MLIKRTEEDIWHRPIGSKRRNSLKKNAEQGIGPFKKARPRACPSAGMGIMEGTEDEVRGRRWAIQFECKGGVSTGQ